MRLSVRRKIRRRSKVMRTGGRVDATHGPVLSSLLRLSLPALTVNGAMVAYEVVNVIWLGILGPGPIAAVAMAFPILAFIWAVGEGITEGGSALVARHAGSRDMEGVSRTAAHVGALLVIYYTTVIIVGLPFLDHVITAVGTPPELASQVSTFIFIMVLGMPLTELLYAYCFMLQAAGNTATPVRLWSITTGINMVLDPILILGVAGFSGWGLTGSAVAIVIGRSIMALYSVAGALRDYHGLHVSGKHFRPDVYLLRRLVRVAAPIAGERMVLSAEQLALVAIVARFGSPALAAYGIGHRIIMMALMPGWAMATAVTATVGQNLGAGEWPRAERGTWTAIALAFSLLTVLGIVVFVWPSQAAALFTRDAGLVATVSELLRVVAPTFGFAGVFVVLGGAYQALERTVSHLVWTLGSSWVLKVPLAVVLSSLMGVSGIWFALAIAHVAASLGSMAWIKLRCYGYPGGAPHRASYTH